MRTVRAILATQVLLTIVACGSVQTTAQSTAEGSDMPSSIPSASTGGTQGEASPSTSALTPSAPNAEAFAKGKALLANGGVRDIGEAEHGPRGASLSGTWNGYLVVAVVAPDGVPLPEGDVADIRELGGERVMTVDVPSRHQPLLRFTYGTFTVDVQVLTKDASDFLSQESHSLVETILCPSECGDVPEGADG